MPGCPAEPPTLPGVEGIKARNPSLCMDSFKAMLSHAFPSIPARRLPSGFQRIGDVAVVNMPGLAKHEKAIGRYLLRALKARAVYKKGPVRGEFRLPRMVRLAGRAGVAVHRENGCLFTIDVSKLMLSKGNLFERGRIIPGEGETIVDMFAGIGYFSLPLARKSPSFQLIAIEKNPVAVRYLRKNIRLNGLGNVQVIQGDCRRVAVAEKADRVLMGYLPGTEAFLPAAFGFLKDRGILHYHTLYRKGDLWERPLAVLTAAGLREGFALQKILYKRVVKSVSPRRYHVVVDALFRRTR